MIKKIIGGLAASIILTQPAIAQEEEKPTQTLIELKQEYDAKLQESCRDNVLTHEEAKQLYKLLNDNFESIALKDLEERQKTSRAEEEKTTKENTEIDANNALLGEKRDKLLEVINEYPGLYAPNKYESTDNYNIHYLPSQELTPEQTSKIKEILTGEDTLADLLNKETLTIGDLINSRTELKKKIQFRKSGNNSVYENLKLRTEIEASLNEQLKRFNAYIKAGKDIEESWFNKTKSLGAGFLGIFLINENYFEPFSEAKEYLYEGINNYSGRKHTYLKFLEIMEEFPNFPEPTGFYFAQSLFFIIAPWLIRAITKSYRKDTRWSDGESNWHGMDALVGALGIDLIHPAITYTRCALPFLHEVYKGLKK